MKRILTAAVLVPLVVLLIFKGSFLWIVISSAVVAELAAWEYLALADSSGAKTPRAFVLIGLGLIFASMLRDTDHLMSVTVLCSLALFVLCAFRSPLERVLLDTATSVFALIYIGLSLTTIPLIWAQGNGQSSLLFLFCVVWGGDVAALYVGRAFGRRWLAPRISPKKTWEGSIASMGGSILIAVLIFYLARAAVERGVSPVSFSGSLNHWVLLAVLLNLGAQIGDLVESAIKRGSGVKDSGNLLPGHGGILDRVDALLIAAPLLWYALVAQQYF
jgi:phosphatidate cytidylyltransferase